MAFSIDSSLDLTTPDLVAGYLGCSSFTDPQLTTARLLISAISLEWLRWTGHLRDSLPPDKSPFIEPVTYDEWYDGSGTDVQFLRSWPIRSVSALEINGASQQLSDGALRPGYAISSDRKYLAMRGHSGAGYRRPSTYIFSPGTMNVHVVSSRGFSSTPSDVVMAVTMTVAANMNRAGAIGLVSQSFSVSGRSASVGYDRWSIPPQAHMVIQEYKCQATV